MGPIDDTSQDAKTDHPTPAADAFELFIAIVLGLGAIGAAWAAFQSDLWGGNQATAYSEAANAMSEAAAVASEAGTDFTEASQTANRDSDLDVQITRLLFEAEKHHTRTLAKAKTEEEKEDANADYTEQKDLAKYLYTSQMSETALKYLGLGSKASADDVSDEELKAASEKSLDEPYYKELYATSEQQYDASRALQSKAKKKFAEGMICNYKADLLAFTGVLYTVCLFLGGIALVFKTRVRWLFAAFSFLMLTGASIHLGKNEWSKLEAPDIADLEVGTAAPSASSAPGAAPAPSGSVTR